MRKILLSILFICCFLSFAQAQFANKGFSFQGYARDFSGAALGNQTLSVKFSIYPQGKAVEYEEVQSLKTDPYGVFHAVIGSVRPADFGKINWTSANYWLKVEVKAYGGDYVEVTNTSLLAVPYANAALNGVPAGSIIPFAGPKDRIPAGYMACDGRELSATEYPALFAAIGNAWGGNGFSTFRVPDLRGQFLRGQNDGSGNDPEANSRYAKNGGRSGDNVGSFQNDQMSSHSHSFSGSTSTNGSHSHGVPSESGGGVTASGTDQVVDNNDGPGSTHSSYSTSSNGDHSHSFSGTTSSAGGGETRAKNAAVYYIIKL